MGVCWNRTVRTSHGHHNNDRSGVNEEHGVTTTPSTTASHTVSKQRKDLHVVVCVVSGLTRRGKTVTSPKKRCHRCSKSAEIATPGMTSWESFCLPINACDEPTSASTKDCATAGAGKRSCATRNWEQQ